jgi:[1-hydroxy-2-(trimethylamino)ethyl]phosphonate dioxygenase
VAAFSASPHAPAAMRLRRWDDGGKLEGIVVPDLPDYRERIARLLKA